MRAVTPLLSFVLLVLLAIGVVHAHRVQQVGLVSRLVPPQSHAERGAADAPALGAEPVADPPVREAAVLEAGEVSVLGEQEREPAVRYTDASGSVHMVRGLERVPPEYRQAAVVLGSGNVNVLDIPPPTAVAFQDWQPEANPNRSGVVLFSAPWCGACKRAKRHLDRQGVAYEERDISDDDDAKQQVRDVLGRVAIPLLEVDGRYISGFRPDVYDRALGG